MNESYHHDFSTLSQDDDGDILIRETTTSYMSEQQYEIGNITSQTQQQLEPLIDISNDNKENNYNNCNDRNKLGSLQLPNRRGQFRRRHQSSASLIKSVDNSSAINTRRGSTQNNIDDCPLSDQFSCNNNNAFATLECLVMEAGADCTSASQEQERQPAVPLDANKDMMAIHRQKVIIHTRTTFDQTHDTVDEVSYDDRRNSMIEARCEGHGMEDDSELKNNQVCGQQVERNNATNEMMRIRQRRFEDTTSNIITKASEKEVAIHRLKRKVRQPSLLDDDEEKLQKVKSKNSKGRLDEPVSIVDKPSRCKTPTTTVRPKSHKKAATTTITRTPHSIVGTRYVISIVLY